MSPACVYPKLNVLILGGWTAWRYIFAPTDPISLFKKHKNSMPPSPFNHINSNKISSQ